MCLALTDLLCGRSWFELLKQRAGIWASRSTCICNAWQIPPCRPEVKKSSKVKGAFTLSHPPASCYVLLTTPQYVPGIGGASQSFCIVISARFPLETREETVKHLLFIFPSTRNCRLSDICPAVKPHILASFPAANVSLLIKSIRITQSGGNLKGCRRQMRESSRYSHSNVSCFKISFFFGNKWIKHLCFFSPIGCPLLAIRIEKPPQTMDTHVWPNDN